MHVRRNQLTIAAVTFVLGLLVVVQLRAQAGSEAFAGLSSQDRRSSSRTSTTGMTSCAARSPRSSATSAS